MEQKTHQSTTTLAEIKKYLKQQYENGCICPACNQHVKMYKRKLTSTMAHVLLLFAKHVRENGNAFVKFQNVMDQLQVPTSQRADWQKLVYFKLIEPETVERGNPRVGYYKMTNLGIEFANERATVPDHCKVYNGKVFGYGIQHTNIKKALKNKFNYNDLMNN